MASFGTTWSDQKFTRICVESPSNDSMLKSRSSVRTSCRAQRYPKGLGHTVSSLGQKVKSCPRSQLIEKTQFSMVVPEVVVRPARSGVKLSYILHSISVQS